MKVGVIGLDIGPAKTKPFDFMAFYPGPGLDGYWALLEPKG